MTERVKIVGIASRKYTKKDTGEIKTYYDLQCVRYGVPGVEGGTVSVLDKPSFVDPVDILIDATYEVGYAWAKGRDGQYLKVVSFDLVA